MAGRFAQARNDGTYRPGTAAANGGQFVPAELVASFGSFNYGNGTQGNTQPAILFDADGKPLDFTAFRSPIDGGPGAPLQPRFPDPNFAPREFQFSPGHNLIPQPRADGGLTPFTELRALVTVCPYLRIAINHRKKQVRGMEWDVSPIDDKSPKAKKASQGDIDRVKKFLTKPNRIDNLRFGEFISQATEEVYTTDALTFYKLLAKDGKELHSLVQIDGGTIKPIIDVFGHVVGYQQVLYGYPTTQYRTAPVLEVIRDVDELAGRIMYLVSVPKVDSVYGSAVAEEIRPVVDVAIRRWARQLSWYTEGTVPASIIEFPATTPAQIAAAQAYFNERFSDSQVNKMLVVPPGANVQQLKPFQYTKEEEEAIISAICADMGTPRSLFVAQVNKATAETQRDEAQDVGFKPLKVFHKDWLDDLIQNDLGCPDLEFDWVDSMSGNEWEIAQSQSLYVSSGIMTVDEIRAEKGLDPLPEEERPEAKMAAMQQALGKIPPKDEKPGEEKPGKPGAFPPGKDEKKAPAADESAQKAEIAAWEKFARKRVEKGKHSAEFIVSALPRDVADAVVRGLKNASTDTDVRAVFAKAKEHLAARRKSYELQLTLAIAHALERQKGGVLDVARKEIAA